MSKMSNVHAMSFKNNNANNEREFCSEGLVWLKAKEIADLAAQMADEEDDEMTTCDQCDKALTRREAYIYNEYICICQACKPKNSKR